MLQRTASMMRIRMVLKRPYSLVWGSLLVLIGIANAWNLGGSPEVGKDEGVYLSQAWAVSHLGSLANYTYWYDHPPLGWIIISGWIEMTDGFGRYHDPLLAGREAMLAIRLALIVLSYVLARRVGLNRWSALVSMSVLGLSPLAISYGRQVYLDNVAMPLLITAFVLAFSPKRRVWAYIGSGLSFGCAVMSKETVLVLLPILCWAVWRNTERGRRGLSLTVCSVMAMLTILIYPLFAVLKNELVPGKGHVSLTWAVQWQLFSRASSGSIFNPHSDARAVVEVWLRLDPWLLVFGLTGTLVSIVAWLCRRDSRTVPLAFALLLQVMMMLRPGYLPNMYVIAMLPFAAILTGYLLQVVWQTAFKRKNEYVRLSSCLTELAIAAVILTSVVPSWTTGVYAQTNHQDNVALDETIAWMDQHVSPQSVMVVEASLWLNLLMDGHTSPRPIWMYKVDEDPAVKAQIGGWERINYLVLQNDTLKYENASTMPTVFTAIKHAKLVVSFGSGDSGYRVYQVITK